ncbi:hypothetical protein [Tahibacter amnicola]|uniref:Uncharacterized protein n=1 Tax=Tahibacter amnicola TaxID=2976241 RepID=A0ABY6BHC1_9GAMM|nr:hypothetical protein [Tahibacter amnicola]UXI69426.1 hypothetical protein N4264_07190 [Tahibacter amnicola]
MNRLNAFVWPLLAIASGATSAADIVPPVPAPFERVNLRMTVDSCVFNDESVRVEFVGGVIRVAQQPNACFVPGPPEVVDIQLGAFPAGQYTVAYYESLQPTAEPVGRWQFQVVSPFAVAFVPPQPRPNTDYAGLWWSPTQSGWGLSILQGTMHSLFGALYVHGAGHQPEWFTIQNGKWTSETKWEGVVVRTVGPLWSAPQYDVNLVSSTIVGTATLDFTQTPSRTGVARFSYTIDGKSVSADIVRISLL